MKHSKQVLIIFMALFFLSQILGLSLVAISADVTTSIDDETNEEITEVTFANTTVGERPNIEGRETIIAIGIGVFFGTVILLVLSKFKKANIWKHWFFFATVITLSISLGVLTNNYLIAWILAVSLSAWKIYKPNYIIHNLTELFIYPGIAILLAPLLNIFYATILLILISIYDAYAVWKSKHMITMAEFTRSANLFPGLALAYDSNTGKIKHGKIESEKIKNLKSAKVQTQSKTTYQTTNDKTNKNKSRTGILGGGDIAFPLIFAATFLVFLLEQGYSNLAAISYTLLISVFAGIALMLLFIYGKQDRYYPAMPFISAGCFVGYFVAIALIHLI